MINLQNSPNFDFLKTLKLGNNFLQGADPEFSLYDEGKNQVVSAKGIISGNSLSSKFGTDGCGTTAEIRPDPSTDPFEIIKDIRQIMLNAVDSYPELFELKWIAGSYFKGFPLGGHIHFGVPFEKSKFDYNLIAKILTQYVGAASLLLEKKEDFLSRKKIGYGAFGEVRQAPHGIEYRTVGSWLTSPYFAASFLCLSRAVMYEIYNENYEFFNDKEYIKNEDFIRGNALELNKNFDKVWKDITGFRLYQEYKPYIDLIYRLVKDPEGSKTWLFINQDMKETWGIVPGIVDTPQEILTMDFIWNRYINVMNNYS